MVLGFPVAITEEVWNMGYELSSKNTFFLALGSLTFQAVFVYYFFYYGKLQKHRLDFAKRLLAIYSLTIVVSAIILLVVDKLPLAKEPIVALKRVIVVALPASFSATIFDKIKK